MNWIKAIISWVMVRFGYRYSSEHIPKNTVYCYDDKGYCKYNIRLNKSYHACIYLGHIGWHTCLDDDCKICYIGCEYRDIKR